MQLLLDTRALLWFVDGADELSRVARELIEDPRNRVFVSVASYWEIVIKQSNGKLSLPSDAPTWFRRAVEPRAFELLSIELAHVSRLHGIGAPGAHKDPFDRLLIATALHHDLSVLTADQRFAEYGVAVIW